MTIKKLYWIAQFVGWTSYVSLIIFATFASNPGRIDLTLVNNVLSLVASGIFWTHIMRLWFFKKHWLELKLPSLIPRVFIISILCSVCISFSTLTISALTNTNNQEVITILTTVINVFGILVLVLFWNSIYFTFHFFQKSRKQELNNITLEASRNEIELKNLRSQLNPHFLFNSLNSIRALIDIEPSKAKFAVTTLSNLLRKSLILGKENLVRLEDELEMISNYLELEKVRFEERLEVKWDLDTSLNDFLIPPFSIQTLVENAIKHGISNLIEGGTIIIQTSQNEQSLIITVLNTGKITGEVDTGIGLENTMRRLALQFKDSAELTLSQEAGNVKAQLLFDKIILN
jgi:LytS/YehU family sensor histidine kinase